MIPPAAKVFDGEVWSEICQTLYEGDEWSVSIERPSWNKWSEEGFIAVSVGDKMWRSKDTGYRADSPAISAVEELLAEMAPMRTTSPTL